MIKLRPEDITRYQFLSQLKMSPSGRHGVFSVSRANLTTNGYDNQLWTLDAQTEAVQALDGTQGAKAFCFLNDETICFTAEGTVEDKARVRRGELLSVVYTIPVSGGEAKILCRIPLRNVSVEALAGNRLLLSSFYDNRRPDFESLPEDEKNAKLAQYALESEWEVCTESPFRRDSRGMVDGKRTRMFIYDLQTGALSPITEPWFDTLSFRVNREGTKVAIIGELFQGRMARMKGVYLYDVEKNTMQELLPDKGYQVSCVEFMNGSVMCSAIPWTASAASRTTIFTVLIPPPARRARYTSIRQKTTASRVSATQDCAAVIQCIRTAISSTISPPMTTTAASMSGARTARSQGSHREALLQSSWPAAAANSLPAALKKGVRRSFTWWRMAASAASPPLTRISFPSIRISRHRRGALGIPAYGRRQRLQGCQRRKTARRLYNVYGRRSVPLYHLL